MDQNETCRSHAQHPIESAAFIYDTMTQPVRTCKHMMTERLDKVGGCHPAGAFEAATSGGLQEVSHDVGDLWLDGLVVALRYAAHVKHGEATRVPQWIRRCHAIPRLQQRRV